MSSSAEFERRFEGTQALAELLSLAGCAYGPDEVADAFREAQTEGVEANEVIPELFEEPPRFADPKAARRLFQNLLGLWDLVLAGQALPEAGVARPPRPKRQVGPPPPGRFGDGGPDEAFVENAWRHLDGLDKREWDRLQHSFENRQDALLVDLDEQGLSDEGFACARHLLFELFAMIELGWAKGTRSAEPSEQAVAEVPQAFWAHVEEALFEAGQDEQSPLSAQEGARVQAAVRRGLSALWSARRG